MHACTCRQTHARTHAHTNTHTHTHTHTLFCTVLHKKKLAWIESFGLTQVFCFPDSYCEQGTVFYHVSQTSVLKCMAVVYSVSRNVHIFPVICKYCRQQARTGQKQAPQHPQLSLSVVELTGFCLCCRGRLRSARQSTSLADT